MKTGDIVSFGRYEQDNNHGNGTEKIEWIVLTVQNGKALLLSRYVLDCISFNVAQRGWVPWAESTYREWLNGDFYSSAFSSSEKGYILKTSNTNDSNPKYGTYGGANTSDYVFALSIAEAQSYLSGTNGRGAPTSYARALGIQTSDSGHYSWWWLRSPGKDSSFTATVWSGGSIGKDGMYVDNWVGGVRPSLWVSTG